MKNALIITLLILASGSAAAQYPVVPANTQAYPPADYQPPPAPASYSVNSTPKFTVPVISATPAYQTEMRERKVCDRQAPSNGTSAVGTVIGGVAGGLLGNQIGRGNGRTVATAAGAVGGALAGSAIANNVQNTPNCQLVSEPQQVFVGYDVVYEFSGQRGQVRMSQQPGSTIVVEVRPVIR
ncbi:glycine zipper 2TM domain-containing protein [Propionivibrio sp.]|uniref:glycine zipper 2TM domain-containing protein n=1 Tax=Propionivibrio sp. TaxID=2212460 RepID=UPI0026154CE6|nr:glycine zipper 2TM domain-containing protein [Propionivibrio sp.]